MDKTIELKVCDLLQQPVQAIVCSANNWLKLGTGVAGLINKYGGEQVQIECNAIIQDNNNDPLPIGSAVLTTTGNISIYNPACIYIVHAIGMGYQKYENGKLEQRILATPNSVSNAIEHVILLAKQHELMSIAMPLMCARPGYSIFTPEEAPQKMLEIMIRTIVNCLNHNDTTIRSITICIENTDLIKYGYELLSALYESSRQL